MSDRFCSAAWALFFHRHVAALEEGPDRPHTRANAPLADQALLHFEEGDVRFRLDEAEEEIAMGLEL
jgi:hypothetical protein